MKYFSVVILFVLLSCGNKEDILLPKSNVTIVSNVVDHSPIYIFFRTKGKDTLAEVNRKNSIISTNWILNIDKRLPLRLVIPEVMKLQEKKRAEVAHKNELAENYYSYADSIGKNMAFLPFTKVYYKMGNAKGKVIVFHFKKGSDIVLLRGSEVKKKDLVKTFYRVQYEVIPQVAFLFDKNMSYQEYIQTKILLGNFKAYAVDDFPIEFIN